MTSEEKFRNSLQNLVESKEFQFKESDWEDAKAVIESERRRGNLGLTIASLALFVLSGIAYLLLHAQQPAGTLKAENLAVQPVVSAPANIVAEPITANDTENNSTAIAKPEPKVIPARRVKAGSRNVASARTGSPVKQQNAGSSEVKLARETPVARANEPISNNASPEVVITREKDKAADTPPVVAPVSPVNNEAITTPVIAQPLPSNDGLTGVTIQPVPEEKMVNKAESSVISEPIQLSATTVSAAPSMTVTKYVMLRPIEVEAGAAFNTGWKYADKRDALGVSPVFGLHYYNPVADKLTVSIGLLYQQINRLSYSSLTSKVTRLGLGEESNVTVISPSKVHLMGVPFKIRFALDDQSQVGIGYHINYLLNVEARVEKYSEKLGTRENERSYTSGGYFEGFRTFSSQISAFYRRKLCGQFSVNGEIVFGLSDLKEDGFFQLNGKERHSGLRISLIYDLNKKQD
jgi:hypothetical protein